MDRSIVLIAHNLRSAHNIGSLIRTAEGLGIHKFYCTGYTPYPTQKNDTRLPHLQRKLTKQINKTALGAEDKLPVEHFEEVNKLIDLLRLEGYQIVAIEQAKASIPINSFTPSDKVALVLGREVEGIEHEVMEKADCIIEIPMFGAKESYNVSVAGAIALYHCRFGA